MWHQPKNPLPPSPFYFLFTHGWNSCHCVTHHLFELSSHSFPLSIWPSHLNSPIHLLSMRVGFPSTQRSVPFWSPFCAQVKRSSTQFSLHCLSPFCARVEFLSIRFSLPCSSPLLAHVRLFPIQFSFTSLCYKYMSVKL
jgi:hypothetical protein